jgi:hypothetical protein
MKIDKFKFGSITIDGKKYNRDVLIYPDGHVEKRKGGRWMFGSHDIRKEEIEQICRDRPDLVIVGTGTDGRANLSFDGEGWSKDKGIELSVSPSGEAVEKVNEIRDRKVAALIHITC